MLEMTGKMNKNTLRSLGKTVLYKTRAVTAGFYTIEGSDTMNINEIYEHLKTTEGIASLIALDDFTPVY